MTDDAISVRHTIKELICQFRYYVTCCLSACLSLLGELDLVRRSRPCIWLGWRSHTAWEISATIPINLVLALTTVN